MARDKYHVPGSEAKVGTLRLKVLSRGWPSDTIRYHMRTIQIPESVQCAESWNNIDYLDKYQSTESDFC